MVYGVLSYGRSVRGTTVIGVDSTRRRERGGRGAVPKIETASSRGDVIGHNETSQLTGLVGLG